MSIVEESLLRNLKILNPNMFSKIIKYDVHDQFTLIFVLDDDSKWLYDDLTDSIRYLPDPNNLTDEELLNEFRFRLKHAMIMRGISQQTLSERTGIPTSMISRYLSGKNIPSILKTMQICRAIGCSLDEVWYM